MHYFVLWLPLQMGLAQLYTPEQPKKLPPSYLDYLPKSPSFAYSKTLFRGFFFRNPLLLPSYHEILPLA